LAVEEVLELVEILEQQEHQVRTRYLALLQQTVEVMVVELPQHFLQERMVGLVGVGVAGPLWLEERAILLQHRLHKETMGELLYQEIQLIQAEAAEEAGQALSGQLEILLRTAVRGCCPQFLAHRLPMQGVAAALGMIEILVRVARVAGATALDIQILA